MATIGEKNYDVDVKGAVDVGGTSVEWNITSTSVFYDPVMFAYFAEIGIAIKGNDQYSIRVQVDNETPDMDSIVSEMEGLIDEIVYLRVSKVIRKNPKSRHRSLLGVV